MARKLSKPLKKPDKKESPCYRYGEGWWKVDTIRVIPGLGKKVRIGIQWFSTQDEAQAAFDIRYQELVDRYDSSCQTKWEELRESYIEDRKNSKIALSTIASKDRAVLKVFFDPYYCGWDVSKIFTKKEAIAFKRRLFEVKNHFGEPYGVKDVNRAVSTYRNLLKLAAGLDLIEKKDSSYYYCDVTVQPVKRRSVPSTGRERPTFSLNQEEENKLLDVFLDGTMDGDLFRFLLWTGFRIGEALALTVNDIDFDQEKIAKEWTWVKDDKGGYFRSHTTKNGSEGIYVVSSKVMDMLRLHVKIFGLKGSDYLFFGKSPNRPLDQSAFGKRVKKVCENIGVRYCHPHILRHTFCTKLASVTNGSNLDRKAIEGLTGHTFDVDQKTYTHASEDRMRELVNKA